MTAPQLEGATTSLSAIRLVNFRNYPRLALPISARFSVVVGDNAQGKTNLLEAMATLLLTKSPRASTAREFITHEHAEAAIDGVLSHGTRGDDHLRIHWQLSTRGGISRTLRLNDAPVSSSTVVGLYPVVLFTPEHLSLLSGGPDERRRFIDMLIAQSSPSGANALQRYRRAVEQRNHALKQVHAGSATPDVVAPFTAALAEYGPLVMAAREQVTSALALTIGRHLGSFTSQAEEIILSYVPSIVLPVDLPHVSRTAAYRVLLENTLTTDLAQQNTTTGPHRDDLECLLNGHPARSTASQGQRRSIVLALLLAAVDYLHAVTSTAPLLLLDDLLSELDGSRQTQMAAALLERTDLQTVMTTTAVDHLPADIRERAHVITISAGRVSADEAPISAG